MRCVYEPYAAQTGIEYQQDMLSWRATKSDKSYTRWHLDAGAIALYFVSAQKENGSTGVVGGFGV